MENEEYLNLTNDNVQEFLSLVKKVDKEMHINKDGYYKTYVMIGDINNRFDLGDGIYHDLSDEELLTKMIADNLQNNICEVEKYLETGKSNWVVEPFLEQGLDVDEIHASFNKQLQERKEVVRNLLKEEKVVEKERRGNMKEIEGKILLDSGYVNIQPTQEQWRESKSGNLDIKDLSAVDKIEIININGRDVSKVNYNLSTKDEFGNIKFSKNYQAIGKEATEVFVASEKKQPVKVILKEKEFDKANGEIGVSYSTMAVENLALNKQNLLDLVDNKEKQLDKAKDNDRTY